MSKKSKDESPEQELYEYKSNDDIRRGGFTFAQWITSAISIVAFFLSTIGFYDTFFRSDVVVEVGRQAMLFAGTSPQLAPDTVRPVVYLSVTLMNKGGKPTVVKDFEIDVEVRNGSVDPRLRGKPVFAEKFFAVGVLNNMLTAEGKVEYRVNVPIPLLGKSGQTKELCFMSSRPINVALVPPVLDVNVSLRYMEYGRWRTGGEYAVRQVANVWDDACQTCGPIFHKQLVILDRIE